MVGFDLIASLTYVTLNSRVNIDFLFRKWYKHALELAQKVSFDDIVLPELKRRFEWNQTFIYSGLHIIPYIMASSPNWRDYFKDFLKFYKDDFENTSLSTVDGEFQFWKQHWKNSNAVVLEIGKYNSEKN